VNTSDACTIILKKYLHEFELQPVTRPTISPNCLFSSGVRNGGKEREGGREGGGPEIGNNMTETIRVGDFAKLAVMHRGVQEQPQNLGLTFTKNKTRKHEKASKSKKRKKKYENHLKSLMAFLEQY
jgi:hypothetical protein